MAKIEDLEEEVRWFMTWKMTPVRIAANLQMSENALSKRFYRAGIQDLYHLFQYSDELRKTTNNRRKRKKREN